MLFSVHAIVHLKDGLVWTTLLELSDDHANDLNKCNVHLCYLGRGIFIELVEQEIPLQVLKDTKDRVNSVVIGEITPDEYQSFDTALSTRLGFRLSPKLEIAQPMDINKSVKSESAGCLVDLHKVEKELQIVLTRCSTSRSFTQPRTPDHVNSPAPQPMAPSSICNKEVRILLDKLSMNANQRFLVSRNIVVGASKVTSGDEDEKVKGSGTIEIKNYSSDDTEAYWPLDPKKQILLFPKVNVQHSMMPTAKLALMHRFNIQVCGIQCKKLCYHFKCVVSGCVKTFDKICNWNLHSSIYHLHIEHFFTFLAGNTVFSLVSESPR